ncbi:MAG: chromosome segregation protein SMC, partial [Gammaproteobacteria bacterium]
MKILELRFKNLNSLYGEWLIDFTSAEYASNGIFALIGPTGAGKSTVLDAICLALYGATPRLGRITTSGNEIMSRHTGECYAEVTFESQAGTFRCHWSQHRARKKPDGKLAISKHEIADALSGQILEANKKKNVASVIEEKTGMDFERFTRSILLAQGGFDTFLKADVEQKSKILEQITGTEIYSEISRRVHERQRDEREKLNFLQAEISGIGILTEQQETEISRELTDKKGAETNTAAKVKNTGKAIAWLTAINDLRNEIVVLSQESEKLNITLETFKPERERLSRALKAAELDGLYATLTGVRKQQDVDHNSLIDEQKQLPKTETSVSKKEDHLKDVALVMFKIKEKQKLQQPVIQKVRLLDQQISDRRKSINTDEIDCKKVTEQIAVNQTLLQQTRDKLETAEKEQQLIQNYLRANSHDESLVSQLAGIEEQLNNLQSVLQDNSGINLSLTEAERHLKSAVKTVAKDAAKLTLSQHDLGNGQQQLALKKSELKDLIGEQLLREYRTEKDTLLREMVLLRKIADLDSERNRLEDGQPCPLCGAEEHPYAQGNVPEADETEKKITTLTVLINKAEKLELSIKKLEVSEKDLLAKVTAAEKLNSKSVNEKENSEKNLKNITTELAKSNER